MADLLTFPDADVAIEPEADEPIAIEPEPDIAIEPEAPAPAPSEPPAAPAALMFPIVEVLPADFKLPALIKFIPNPALRIAADHAATYALGLRVEGAEGLQRADTALSAVRASLKTIDAHLEEPIGIANDLHKRLTSVRAEWSSRGKQAIDQVGRAIYTEQKRLEAIAAEERRTAQAEADRQARAAAQREAEAAAKAQAPAPVVQELKRQAETATAPPVATSAPAPTLRGSSTVTTWKARIVGTSGSDEPNPTIEGLSVEQRHRVLQLLTAIVEGKAPLAAIEVNWSYLNKRAKSDKGTLEIPSIEAFEEGSVRAKGTRSR